jgi:adenylate kinase family enzyme
VATIWVTLLGGPGAGKTTVGQALESASHKALGPVRYVSGSRLLDEYISERKRGWKDLKERKDEGHTADQALTHEILSEHLSSLTGCGLVLLDGFPKSMEDMSRTEKLLPGGLDFALLLACPAAIRAQRIANRRVCNGCGEVTGAPPPFSGPACACGGQFERRKDDDPGVVGLREQTSPPQQMAKHFSQSNRLLTVAAGQPLAIVVAESAAVIERATIPPSRKIRDS